MEYDEQNEVFGDIPPNLETLSALPERMVRTVRSVGNAVIQAVYGQETTTGFDSASAVYATR